ncbi:hypothetical protein [Pseudomonas extremaustralis]|uniref:hypothetical protein n=1 Tax=Pseudomonas extremaustralis TaxID=359110 RepID=UPI0012387560|nr:hypothetical protein [Pseudomonas extremaustralis]
MKIRRTLEKRMKDIEASGRGCFHEEAEEGAVLFSTNLEDGRLDVYMDGFSFGKNESMNKVLFADISSINSHLKVELFSNAGLPGDLVFYVPLDIKYGLSHFSLSLPFLTYSNVMNILIGLREDWIRQSSSSS